MMITVILCTYNRCKSLPNALESLAASKLPDSVEWEVLVVDNNSRDQTRAVVEEFRRRYPGRFRYLFESRQGLSNARNAGVREARGDVVAFTDDDVTVEPAWLQNLTANLHDNKWAGTGGRIRLARNFSLPRWMLLEGPYSLAGQLAAVFDAGDKPCEISRPPFGANMAFRKTMFERYGGFRTDLGRCADGLIGSEDTEFGERLIAAGERLWYAPSAVVNHSVLEERLTKKYFQAWFFSCGRAEIRQRGRAPGKWGIPRYYFSLGMLAWNTLKWLRTMNCQKRFFLKCGAWRYAGKVVENYHQSRDRQHHNPGELARSKMRS
jgi:glycosyltransferase involved in cell wall biosynthesis